LTIGFFDGVHLGHRKIISTAIRIARKTDGETWVLTFDNHPRGVVAPSRAPELLTDTEQKLHILQSLGVNGCIVLRFDRKLAMLEPDEFAEKLTSSIPTLDTIVVGENWRFGRNRKATASDMSRLVPPNVRMVTVKMLKWKGEPISSSRIRLVLKTGALREVERMLGRPWILRGVVVHGRGIGRKIGFPTGNLDVRGRALPAYGVYAVFVKIVSGGKSAQRTRVFPGVGNLGVRPTFNLRRRIKPLFEFYLFGRVKRLYGKRVEVIFVHKLRDERYFSEVQLLAEQIKHDCEQAMKILKTKRFTIFRKCI